MPTESLELTEILKTSPERVYRAWLDSKEHSEITGAPTTIQPAVGATFQASDGYIHGMNLVLEPHRRIVQTWRTTEFPPGAPHSKVELLFDPVPEGTKLTLRHTDIPEGQADRYREGWRDYYFSPMSDYFGSEETPRGNAGDDTNVGAPPSITTPTGGPDRATPAEPLPAELPLGQAKGTSGPVLGAASRGDQRQARNKESKPARTGTGGRRAAGGKKTPARTAAAATRKAAPAKKAATGKKKGKPEGRKSPKASTAKKATARGAKLVARAERGAKKGAARTGGVTKKKAPARATARSAGSTKPSPKGRGRR